MSEENRVKDIVARDAVRILLKRELARCKAERDEAVGLLNKTVTWVETGHVHPVEHLCVKCKMADGLSEATYAFLARVKETPDECP